MPRQLDPGEVAKREAEERKHAEKRERQALACWNAAQDNTSENLRAYLRVRGITCAFPDTLRYLPTCWHPSAQRLPAMVARVDGAKRFAVHRTYLRADGMGKASIEPTKAMLGATAGGAVRLSDGPGPLYVTEGIETGLSLLCGLVRGPATVWAALSAPGMSALNLPRTPGRLVVAPDGDEPGRKAANDLGTRAAALGWSVSMLPAPDGRDWNDVLTMKGVPA